MKILHLCLGNYYIDGYSYQENNLVHQHKEAGHEVEVIASLLNYNENGNVIYDKQDRRYVVDGVQITRLQYRFPKKIMHKLKTYRNAYSAIEAVQPDFIFIHGVQFFEAFTVRRYLKKHPNVVAVADSHVDGSNSARNKISYNILHKMFWRKTSNLLEPYVKRFYGTLPIRVDFLKNVYKLPPEKCELLVMGADDDLVEKSAEPHVRKSIRTEHNISEEDFLIVTGGKIDLFKKQTLLLMEAVKQMKNPKVKLLVFGSVVPELKENLASLCDESKIQYIGWIHSDDSYNYFAAADLAVFPGRHSVFWEQVAAQGIPMICKHWNGTTHIDLGGNVKFLYEDSVEEIKYQIENLVENQKEYAHMKQIAVERGMKEFSYKDIAKRAIEV